MPVPSVEETVFVPVPVPVIEETMFVEVPIPGETAFVEVPVIEETAFVEVPMPGETVFVEASVPGRDCVCPSYSACCSSRDYFFSGTCTRSISCYRECRSWKNWNY